MDIHVATGRRPAWEEELVIRAFPPLPPEQLRRQAALWRRLARTLRDPAAAARFEAWADQYEARAATGPAANEGGGRSSEG
jgi:hypothetical protein